MRPGRHDERSRREPHQRPGVAHDGAIGPGLAQVRQELRRDEEPRDVPAGDRRSAPEVPARGHLHRQRPGLDKPRGSGAGRRRARRLGRGGGRRGRDVHIGRRGRRRPAAGGQGDGDGGAGRSARRDAAAHHGSDPPHEAATGAATDGAAPRPKVATAAARSTRCRARTGRRAAIAHLPAARRRGRRSSALADETVGEPWRDTDAERAEPPDEPARGARPRRAVRPRIP